MTDGSARLSLRRLWALCRKESLQIVRDPSSIVIAFILPTLLLFIFGYGVNLDSSRIRIGIVLEDSSAEAQRFADAFFGSPYVEAVPARSRETAMRALTAGEVRGFVIVPSDFSTQLERRGAAAPIQLVTDGSEPNTANFVASYTRGVFRVWQQQRNVGAGITQRPTISMEPRFWFNPSTVSRNFLVPGAITIVMTLIGAMLTSLVVAREWERGTMEALLSTPLTRTELLLSKLLPYYVLGIVSMLLCVAVAVWILHVPFRGSLLVLLGVTTLFLGSALGLGLVLSSVTRNQFNAAQAALNAAFLPTLILSGAIYEIASAPPFVQAISRILPARYFVSTLQTLFQAGTLSSIVIHNAFYLTLLAVFFLGLTARFMKRRLD